ncbi:MAG TPA: hypothetical protein DCS07_06790 [Bdellovibrionales bacterium]|nr:MAG: hypothetical protein A2Z97_11480 [Bdellovibrionales bacterium GWB1_52_6]OFZ03876.1 MAG: hypothetical protein A2X97_15870 [Bdellovibrionales bacterium GWA1_52_35]OFZ40294.1 MAG: hypothetical protein A2070_11035 [Bdellovibrionales bacterium GWC1_52_8]HAR42325.1 hypothetical protein [Bdellovibrionales bacterium]HCM39689.1 hypothetical protein [Bdellovibrionales bacterium]
MNLSRTKHYLGANIHSRRPLIAATLQLDEPADHNPDRLHALRQHYAALLPIESSATAIPQLLLEVLRQLSLKSQATFLNAWVTPSKNPTICNLFVESPHKKAIVFLLRQTVEWFSAVKAPEESTVSTAIAQATALVRSSGILDSVRALLAREVRSGLPWFATDNEGGIQLGYGINGVQFGAKAADILQKIKQELELRPPASFRIPIVSITGTNGKTTVTRMIAHILSSTGICVGMSSTDGIFVDGICVKPGDLTGPRSARRILADPSVEFAVLETARGGLIRAGLGYDAADVAVLTNIQPDHFGQDGIDSLQDLIQVKKVVADQILPSGSLVINADDEQLASLFAQEAFSHVRKRIVPYSVKPDHRIIRQQLQAGARAYCLQNGFITELFQEKRTVLLRADEMNSSLPGLAGFQIANSLAVTAAARALGCSTVEIVRGLLTFKNEKHNPGRMNLFRLKSGHLLVDYGHNPEAIRAIGEWASAPNSNPAWNPKDVTCILGLPGDRTDSLLQSSARMAARYFRKIILREDEDLRGRAPGELAEIMRSAIQTESGGCQVEVILNGAEALRRALQGMGSRSLTVLFYDEWAPFAATLSEFKAAPAEENLR